MIKTSLPSHVSEFRKQRREPFMGGFEMERTRVNGRGMVSPASCSGTDTATEARQSNQSFIWLTNNAKEI